MITSDPDSGATIILLAAGIGEDDVVKDPAAGIVENDPGTIPALVKCDHVGADRWVAIPDPDPAASGAGDPCNVGSLIVFDHVMPYGRRRKFYEDPATFAEETCSMNV